MPVHIEKSSRVTTIILDRPEVKNAVDGPTAEALAQAFRDFDADPDADVAVLCGASDSFCANARATVSLATSRRAKSSFCVA